MAGKRAVPGLLMGEVAKRTRSMNHFYRIVFNRALGLWQAVSENARKQGKQAGRSNTCRRSPSRRVQELFPVLALTSLLISGLAQPVHAQTPHDEGSGDITPALPPELTEEGWYRIYQTSSIHRAGNGSLTIQDGGRFSTQEYDSFIGDEANAKGTLRVSGAGSTFMTSALGIGVKGTGTLAIEDGGSVTSSADSVIGASSGGVGSVRVTGPGSVWEVRLANMAKHLVVGSAGNGTLLVENGGRVVNYDGFIGYTAQGIGAVTVTGPDSRWSAISFLVGHSGEGPVHPRRRNGNQPERRDRQPAGQQRAGSPLQAKVRNGPSARRS